MPFFPPLPLSLPSLIAPFPPRPSHLTFGRWRAPPHASHTSPLPPSRPFNLIHEAYIHTPLLSYVCSSWPDSLHARLSFVLIPPFIVSDLGYFYFLYQLCCRFACIPFCFVVIRCFPFLSIAHSLLFDFPRIHISLFSFVSLFFSFSDFFFFFRFYFRFFIFIIFLFSFCLIFSSFFAREIGFLLFRFLFQYIYFSLSPLIFPFFVYFVSLLSLLTSY